MKSNGHSDETSFETVFEEYPFFGLGPGDVVCESVDLSFLAVWYGGEKVEEGSDWGGHVWVN